MPVHAAIGRFEEFHRENPQVYHVLDRLAHEWIRSTGRHRLGIAALYERARWELAIQTGDPDFKLNNDYRSFYSRLLMIDHPELDGLFQLRDSVADDWARTKLMEMTE